MLDQLLRIKRLPDEALRTPSGGLLGRLLVDLAAEHHDRDRADSMPFLDSPEHLPPIDLGHHHVEQDQVGRDFFRHSESFLRVAGLAHRVALHFEVDAHVLAHSLVVVDDQDERPLLRRAAGPRAVEEVVEVRPPIAPMPARRVKRGHSAVIGSTSESCSGRRPGTLAAWPSVSQSGSLVGARLPGNSRRATIKSYPKLSLLNLIASQ